MNYRVQNMKFIKATEAKRLTDKALQTLLDDNLEDLLEDVSENIESLAEEGFDTMDYEVEESRLLEPLCTYLRTQGYNVVTTVEPDEDNYATIAISWVATNDNL